jgi:putative membrane protein
VARFATPRRLHPASVVLGIPAAQVIQALVVPVFATLAAGGGFTIWLLALIGVVGLVGRTLDWRYRRFSFDGEVLRVDHGVLSRNHRSLDVARIQQVEIQRGAIQRLLGLAAIRVETAGSASEPEVDLRVVPEEDAVALRAAVRASQLALAAGEEGGRPPGEPEERPALKVPMRHVVIAAVTGARLLVFPAVIGAGFQFVGQQLGNFTNTLIDFLQEQGVPTTPERFAGPDARLIALLVVAVIVLSVLAAVVVGVFRDGNFRIVRIDDDLHISRGLISTRDSVVPLRRVQLVEVDRNWLRRLLGFTTVRIRSAGGSTGGDGRVTVPLLPASQVDALLTEILPGVPGLPELVPHPVAARRRALFRWLRPAVATIAVVWIVPEFVGFLDVAFVDRLRWIVLALLPINAVLAVVEYRQLAHGLTELVVASRRGALSISTAVSPVVKVQAVSSRRSFFQRRLGLTTTVAHVAGPGAIVEVLDADRDDADRLHRRLTAHAASPTPVGPGTPADPVASSKASEPGAAGTEPDEQPGFAAASDRDAAPSGPGTSGAGASPPGDGSRAD